MYKSKSQNLRNSETQKLRNLETLVSIRGQKKGVI